MLGERIINLGEFADFNHPTQRAWPLKNCKSSTVLHDQGLEDDGFNDLHNSGSGSNGQRNKERNIFQSTLQYSSRNFDSSEVPSTTGVNSPHTHSPHGSLQGYQGGGGTSEELHLQRNRSRQTLLSSAAPIDVLIKDLINFAKDNGLQSSTPVARNASVKLIGVLHRCLGPDIKGFLNDLKSTLQGAIDAEIEKNPYEAFLLLLK
ncbi:unnamed protein product [Sphagnum troendelagicum]|uniref:Uncharacterized protein n=1 Tax=Sphagnum troendelagicum TaxID=128251 RepID=A0ABP0UZY6_9BRYO